MVKKNKTLLLYPSLGFFDSFVKHIPLSLIYVAVDSVKAGYDVELIDFRVEKRPMEEILKEKLTDDVIAVGVSVISGEPIKGAVQISNVVRKNSSAKIIWGGSHPTIRPEEVIKQEYVDFVVRGYGSGSLNRLLGRIADGDRNYEGIPGVCYRENGKIIISEINARYEFFDYKDIPYNLLDKTMHEYFTADQRTMAIYTSAGCPYQCAFCISPVWYRSNEKKWVPFEVDYVIGHMEYLIKKYGINFFYLYDDDSFVKVSHFMDIAKEVKRRGLKVKIGVRGIRVNELDKIKDEEFKLLEEIGMTTIHIGVESGSQRMLDLMKKGISVERSLEINRRLAKFPNIIPLYNLLVGFPTETIEDLKETKRLMIQLGKENQRCIVSGPYKFIPYPGSELYKLAERHGFVPPEKLEDWSLLDQEKEICMPWYSKKYNNYIKMLYVEQNILDNRFDIMTKRHRILSLFAKFLVWLYKPIGKLRLKFDFTAFLIEYMVLKLFFKK